MKQSPRFEGVLSHPTHGFEKMHLALTLEEGPLTLSIERERDKDGGEGKINCQEGPSVINESARQRSEVRVSRICSGKKKE